MSDDINFIFHTLKFKFSNKYLFMNVLSPENNESLLSASIAQKFSIEVTPKYEVNQDNLFFNWSDCGHLTVMHYDLGQGRHKYEFKFISFNNKTLVDMFDMRRAHWYGGSQIMHMTWPVEKWQMKLGPYVAGDSFHPNIYGGVQERYFFSSKGVAIFVEHEVPLFVGINESDNKQLTLVSKFESPYYNPDKKQPFLNYCIFQDKGLKEVHMLTSGNMIPKPIDCPDELVFKYPIWSTWAIYKKNINQQIILDYADDILRRGFKSCQLEIDDDWTPHYGDMVFDQKKFPDVKQMMRQLKEKNFRVTLWVHPFASNRAMAAGENYWLTSYTGGYSVWWNGVGKYLDVTNPAANDWFRTNLQKLSREYGIDSFKFDAGEINWFPPGYGSHQNMMTPNEYPRKYAELCYSVDTELRAQEVRVGVKTQHLPILVRMMDKQSSWDYYNGLKTLIPHTLVFGLIGYPFVLPDMVGGNAYNGFPSKTLYVRWMEANALLPCIQISIPPWHYDEEVVRISKKMLDLHESFSDVIIRLAKECKETGAPIIRPLWWIAPDDEVAQILDSEFLVGDDLLVAPVLEDGMFSRSIYLPKGKWKCNLSFKEFEGGQWYDKFEVKLDELPHFSRISAS